MKNKTSEEAEGLKISSVQKGGSTVPKKLSLLSIWVVTPTHDDIEAIEIDKRLAKGL